MSTSGATACIVFTRSGRDAESYEATAHPWLYEIGSGPMRQITAGEKGESNPRWLDDGRIPFTAGEGHGIQGPRHRLVLDGEQEAWFGRHILGDRPRAQQDRPES